MYVSPDPGVQGRAVTPGDARGGARPQGVLHPGPRARHALLRQHQVRKQRRILQPGLAGEMCHHAGKWSVTC